MKNEKLIMAYLAGVMDGDGSFSICKLANASKNPLYFPVIQCAGVKGQYIELLWRLFGGTVFTYKACVLKNGENGRQKNAWRLRSNKNCKPFLEKIIPFLKIKKERSEFLLKFINEFKFVRGISLTKETIIDRERRQLKMMSFNHHTNFSSSIHVKTKHLSQDLNFWSYLAGIMDTDGSFSIKKQVSNKGTHVINARYIPVISISMCDMRAINYIRSHCPFGNFCIPRNTGTSNGIHYHFQIHSKKDGSIFLKNIVPFLRAKKDCAELLLKFCENSSNTKYCKAGVPKKEIEFRESCHQELKNLNKYGVYKPTLIGLEVQKQDDRAQG